MHKNNKETLSVFKKLGINQIGRHVENSIFLYVRLASIFDILSITSNINKNLWEKSPTVNSLRVMDSLMNLALIMNTILKKKNNVET